MCFVLIFVHFQVRWFQQQHEKVRKKRDYTADYYNYQKFGLLRSIAPQSRLQYRQVGEPLFFPDPFFKEQWYLVSWTHMPFSFFIGKWKHPENQIINNNQNPTLPLLRMGTCRKPYLQSNFSHLFNVTTWNFKLERLFHKITHFICNSSNF